MYVCVCFCVHLYFLVCDVLMCLLVHVCVGVCRWVCERVRVCVCVCVCVCNRLSKCVHACWFVW